MPAREFCRKPNFKCKKPCSWSEILVSVVFGFAHLAGVRDEELGASLAVNDVVMEGSVRHDGAEGALDVIALVLQKLRMR